MGNELMKAGEDTLEQVVIAGDLKALTPAQRVEYYTRVCNSIGLNPLTKPFDYITLNGKLTLYARKDAADQLRKIHGISITGLETEVINDVYCVTATAVDSKGRTDIDTGAVSIKGLTGEALANAMMKARTKAKRRVALSIAGLGWLDETEVETIPDARPVIVDNKTGEIVTVSNGNGNGKQAVPVEVSAIVAQWKTPTDALEWAVKIDAVEVVPHAKNLLEKIKREQFNGKWTGNEMAIYIAFYNECMKRAQENEAAAKVEPDPADLFDAPQMNPDPVAA